MSFTINVLCVDVVDDIKKNDKEQIEPFFGNDNKQDILNTQLMVLNGLQSSLRRGGLFQQDFIIDDSISAELVEESFENTLSGWAMDISIEVPNSNISDINANGQGCL